MGVYNKKIQHSCHWNLRREGKGGAEKAFERIKHSKTQKTEFLVDRSLP